MLDSIQRNVTWRAIPIAGVVAGTGFLLATLLLTPILLDIKGIVFLRYSAGLLLGSDSVTDTSNSVLVVGLLVHYALSMVAALVIAIVVHRWGLLVGVVGGALLGAAIYAINFFTITTFVEWFYAIHSDAILISHILFGAVAGGVYELFDHYDRPMFPAAEAPAER